MDIWTKEKRSRVMSNIRGKDTKPEIVLRSALFRRGYRFRIHQKNLLGKPDIVFPKFKTIIFIHGCFWHYHKKCREGRIPSSNSEYWEEKLKKNRKRDKLVISKLKALGWRTIIIWECEVEKQLGKTINRIVRSLSSISLPKNKEPHV